VEDGLRILLAEDHPVNQKVAVRMLERLGHSVIVAPDGLQTLRALEAGTFDVVLMDVQMPEMDGFEAVRAIREREGGSRARLPVLALTAHAMHGDRERCLEAGFDAYLAKPIRQADLQAALEALGPHRRGVDDDSRGPGHPVLAALNTLCGGDDEFARELAESFLQSAPRCLGGIDLALHSGDACRLAAEAHGLKGISRTIGADDLADACQAMEDAAHQGDLRGAGAEARRVDDAWERLQAAFEHFTDCKALT
jgi:CheY-like chemotaxis protein